mmetsp:Transcript_35891/g.112799  ORF Transcript_35891/g.112799 Transcript_35891/m.112799 type:complete len:225 (-) Transcript_35891:9-683(-)
MSRQAPTLHTRRRRRPSPGSQRCPWTACPSSPTPSGTRCSCKYAPSRGRRRAGPACAPAAQRPARPAESSAARQTAASAVRSGCCTRGGRRTRPPGHRTPGLMARWRCATRCRSRGRGRRGPPLLSPEGARLPHRGGTPGASASQRRRRRRSRRPWARQAPLQARRRLPPRTAAAKRTRRREAQMLSPAGHRRLREGTKPRAAWHGHKEAWWSGSASRLDCLGP